MDNIALTKQQMPALSADLKRYHVKIARTKATFPTYPIVSTQEY